MYMSLPHQKELRSKGMYKDFKTLKVGDRFVESEYGTSHLLEVSSKPKLERDDYMTFNAKVIGSTNGKRIGDTVQYGFSYPSGAYNPTILDEEWFNGLALDKQKDNV